MDWERTRGRVAHVVGAHVCRRCPPLRAGATLIGAVSAAFDTLRIARDLEAAGIERRHAEAHAEALRIVADSARAEAAMKADLAGFATKADLETAIASLETRLRKDMATKTDLETVIASLETRILKYGFGMVLATVSLTVALIKLL